MYLHFTIYIIIIFDNITAFNCIFDQINVVFVSVWDIFNNIKESYGCQTFEC